MEFFLMGDFNRNLLQSHCNQIIKTYADNLLGQGGPTSALLWATFQNYSNLRASAG